MILVRVAAILTFGRLLIIVLELVLVLDFFPAPNYNRARWPFVHRPRDVFPLFVVDAQEIEKEDENVRGTRTGATWDSAQARRPYNVGERSSPKY
jgi:hypothetical protein